MAQYGGQMNSRSMLWDRIRIQFEIGCEAVGDLLGGSGGSCFRRPLVWFAGVAVFMTMRSARRGVLKMKNAGYTSTGMGWGTQGKTAGGGYGGYGGYGSSYGSSSTTSGYGSASALGAGGTSGGYGRSALGGGSTTGSLAGGAYGSQSMTAGVGYGSAGSALGGVGTAGGIRGSSTGTANLADTHGPSLRVLENNLFKDYGQIHSFGGQVETLQAFDGAGVVEKVLQSPGNGKVLVVDGGGSVRSSIFDGTAAATAQRSGWAGVIIHGAIRNADAISTTPIGVKALGTNPVKGHATQGSKGSTINIAGLQFSSGMWVHADKDGIVVSDQQLSSGAASSYGAGSTLGAGGTTTAGGYGMGGTTAGGYGLGGTTAGGYGAAGSMVGGGTNSYGTAGTTGYGAAGSTAGYGASGATAGYGAGTTGYGGGAAAAGATNSGGALSNFFGSGSKPSGYGGAAGSSNSFYSHGAKRSSYGNSNSWSTTGTSSSKSKLLKIVGYFALFMFIYSFFTS